MRNLNDKKLMPNLQVLALRIANIPQNNVQFLALPITHQSSARSLLCYLLTLF